MAVTMRDIGPIPRREIETRRDSIHGFLSDCLAFLAANLKHYAFAAWGARLRLDPDYPPVARFFPRHIADTVFEYRSYPFMLPWAAVLACVLPIRVLAPLVGWWAAQSWIRAAYYKSQLAFWERAAIESPRKMRVRLHHIEELLRDLEAKYKTGGLSWEELRPEIERASRLIERICNR